MIFVGKILGKLHIVAGFHGELAAALRARTEVGGIAEHLGQRNIAVDLVRAVACFQRPDGAAAAGDVADHVAHILVRDDDADLHDRLEDDGIRFLAGFLERHGTGDLECQLGGTGQARALN